MKMSEATFVKLVKGASKATGVEFSTLVDFVKSAAGDEDKQPSYFPSVLGGGIDGAATGALIGGGIPLGIGAMQGLRQEGQLDVLRGTLGDTLSQPIVSAARRDLVNGVMPVARRGLVGGAIIGGGIGTVLGVLKAHKARRDWQARREPQGR